MGRVWDYVSAREWAVRENLQDLADALQSGYFEEILHFFGAESPSILSQRAQVRRAYARQVARGLHVARPELPKIQPGQLKVT